MIKFYALCSLLCFSTILVHAQFEKGQKVIGGNINFSISNVKNENAQSYNSNYTSISINPSLATFYKANMLRGIGLSYGYTFERFKDFQGKEFSRSKNQYVGVGLYTQRFITLAKKLYLTVRAGGTAQYVFGKRYHTDNGILNIDDKKVYGVFVSVAPGITYWLTNRLLVDAYLNNLINIGYSHSTTDYTDNNITSKQNSFALSSSLTNTNLGNVGVGFRWLLKK